MNHTLEYLIKDAMEQLGKLGLSDGTLKSYATRAFTPISRLYKEKFDDNVYPTALKGLETEFHEQFNNNQISRKTLNWRLRGIRILLEISETGTFEWKVYKHKTPAFLCKSYENILWDFSVTLDMSQKRIRNTCSIIRRFLMFISEQNIKEISGINQPVIRAFVIKISESRPKSMDDVMTALRQFFHFLNEMDYCTDRFWMLLASPRTREHRVHPSMKQEEIYSVLEQIDRSSSKGKRDFAILILAVFTGLRAGDISSLKLEDVKWATKELHLIQGKTQKRLILPLSKEVLTAIADYILNGRPDTADEHLFIRSVAPYTNLQDGVSIACIFRKYLKNADIIHVKDDGRTMHGIRRTIGTQMVAANVPVTTVSQVLGHTGIKATKQYISMDMKGLQRCTLGFDSIGGASDV